MASNIKTCDICNQVIEEIVAKLYLAPIGHGKNRGGHNNYSAHMDVGSCCIEKITKLGTWQKRRSNAEAGQKKRHRAA